jgi:two-component system nitrate/nitrite response regulator NarP
MVSIALFTDEPALASGFLATLENVPDVQARLVEGAASELSDALLLNPPDLLLVDWGACGGLDILTDLRASLPHVQIVLWVREIAVETASCALSLGIRGILRKTLKPDQMVVCIRAVAGGDIWLENKLTSELLATKQVNLSPRESEIVKLLSRGLKNKEIADEMGLAEGTVKIYLSRLFQKTGAKDRLELALFGLKNTRPSGGPPALVRTSVPLAGANTPPDNLVVYAARRMRA